MRTAISRSHDASPAVFVSGCTHSPGAGRPLLSLAGRSCALILALLFGLTSHAVEPTTLALGSCLRQWREQPVWQGILATRPAAFVFMGDNVYTDTGFYSLMPEPGRIGKAYAELAANPAFASFRRQVPIHATWDDHDYGRNDAGAEYPYRRESKEYFMRFFGVPANAAMRAREGVYSRHRISDRGRDIDLILLDTRSFRAPLVTGPAGPDCPRRRLVANRDPAATLLGDAQWRWLESMLKEPAELRVIVSSIQVIPDAHCWEKWANFPADRQRLLDLLLATGSTRSILVSGDRHLAEISRLRPESWPNALYELTSSGLNSAGAGEGERNPYRTHPDNVRVDNFATIRADDARLHLEIRGVDGHVLQALALDRAAWTEDP